ncbi:MAG: hypothetical protein PHE55_14590 [Methylococcaceae bacterium]|nr:hypothetical protein [Methylococcaceae bacterium]
MTELLAVLTAIFVIYVLYEVFQMVSRTGEEPEPSATHTSAAAQHDEPAHHAKAEPLQQAVFRVSHTGVERLSSEPVEAPSPEQAMVEPEPQSAPAISEPVSAPKTVATEPVAHKPAAISESEKALVLRNPLTDETSPVPGNYRFAKKWIKEILVQEGLLKKVYKNSELNNSNSQEIKNALEKLKLMEKYRA